MKLFWTRSVTQSHLPLGLLAAWLPEHVRHLCTHRFHFNLSLSEIISITPRPLLCDITLLHSDTSLPSGCETQGHPSQASCVTPCCLSLCLRAGCWICTRVAPWMQQSEHNGDYGHQNNKSSHRRQHGDPHVAAALRPAPGRASPVSACGPRIRLLGAAAARKGPRVQSLSREPGPQPPWRAHSQVCPDFTCTAGQLRGEVVTACVPSRWGSRHVGHGHTLTWVAGSQALCGLWHLRPHRARQPARPPLALGVSNRRQYPRMGPK